jgi:histidyl-tRNA synthetase
MKNRYIVKEDNLSKYDLGYPNARVYRLYDRIQQRLSLSYYLTYEAAQIMADNKNEQSN